MNRHTAFNTTPAAAPSPPRVGDGPAGRASPAVTPSPKRQRGVRGGNDDLDMGQAVAGIVGLDHFAGGMKRSSWRKAGPVACARGSDHGDSIVGAIGRRPFACAPGSVGRWRRSFATSARRFAMPSLAMAPLMMVVFAAPAFAQSGGTFEIRRSQFTGGGGTSTGGTFAMFGTAGQHDAGDLTGGTFLLRGGFIQPASGAMSCVDNIDCDDSSVCTFDQCSGGACANLPNTYGDVDFNNTVNLFDLFCVLDGFGGVFGGDTNGNCTFERMDIEPCGGNGSLNLFDLFAILDSFSGIDPCCSPSPTQPLSDRPGLAVDRLVDTPVATIKLVVSQRSVRAGDTVTVDVFASAVTELRGYQIALEAAGGSRGSLESETLAIDDSRDDYVFAQMESVQASDPDGVRIVGALMADSATTRGDTYLGSFTYRIPSGAHGTFSVDIRPEETMLVDTAGRQFAIGKVRAAKITVR